MIVWITLKQCVNIKVTYKKSYYEIEFTKDTKEILK